MQFEWIDIQQKQANNWIKKDRDRERENVQLYNLLKWQDKMFDIVNNSSI